VLIYVHKEQMLGECAAEISSRALRHGGRQAALLRLMKAQLGERLTTVFVRQGHYAHDPHIVATEPSADVQIDTIADLLKVEI